MSLSLILPWLWLLGVAVAAPGADYCHSALVASSTERSVIRILDRALEKGVLSTEQISDLAMTWQDPFALVPATTLSHPFAKAFVKTATQLSQTGRREVQAWAAAQVLELERNSKIHQEASLRTAQILKPELIHTEKEIRFDSGNIPRWLIKDDRPWLWLSNGIKSSPSAFLLDALGRQLPEVEIPFNGGQAFEYAGQTYIANETATVFFNVHTGQVETHLLMGPKLTQKSKPILNIDGEPQMVSSYMDSSGRLQATPRIQIDPLLIPTNLKPKDFDTLVPIYSLLNRSYQVGQRAFGVITGFYLDPPVPKKMAAVAVDLASGNVTELNLRNPMEASHNLMVYEDNEIPYAIICTDVTHALDIYNLESGQWVASLKALERTPTQRFSIPMDGTTLLVAVQIGHLKSSIQIYDLHKRESLAAPSEFGIASNVEHFTTEDGSYLIWEEDKSEFVVYDIKRKRTVMRFASRNNTQSPFKTAVTSHAGNIYLAAGNYRSDIYFYKLFSGGDE